MAQLTTTLALALAPPRIAVNAVVPGQPLVMFYNGATIDARWRIGWIAFDANYTKVVDRCIEPLRVPPPPESAPGPTSPMSPLEDRLLRRALVRQLEHSSRGYVVPRAIAACQAPG